MTSQTRQRVSRGARRATVDDLDQVVDVLVESHLDYAWEKWALQGDDRRKRLADLYRTDLDVLAFNAGEVWMTDCGSSVAVWLPNDAYQRLDDEEHQRLDIAAREAFGERLAIVEKVDAVVAAGRPQADWYLATMGTLPWMQRRGLGTEVLRPRLLDLDERRRGAALDTSAADNLIFYAQLGFDVVATFERLPDGAPTTWSMTRVGSS